VRSTALLAFVIFSLAIFTLQPCFSFSTIISSIYAIGMSGAGLFLLVYQPHQAFFNKPSIHWISPPEDVYDMSLTFLLGMLGSLYYIYGIHKRIFELFPDDWFCAAFFVFCDGVYSMFVMVRATNYVCPGRGGGNSRMDGAVDAISMIV
jgi:hypothetical protein